MISNKKILMLATTYIVMFPVIFILPFFSISGYSVLENNLSDLGAQSTPFAWIMNSITILLATTSVIAIWPFFEGSALHRILLLLSGISLTLAGLFNDAPVIDGINYNLAEAGLHSYFECTAAFSFILLSFATGFIMERQYQRLLALAAGFSVIVLSVLTSESDHLAGIWHRMIYIISFGWIIFTFK
jgi:hypothetical membrane protein